MRDQVPASAASRPCTTPTRRAPTAPSSCASRSRRTRSPRRRRGSRTRGSGRRSRRGRGARAGTSMCSGARRRESCRTMSVAAAGQYVAGMLGYLDFARYWRWYLLVAMAVFELHAATRPSFPPPRCPQPHPAVPAHSIPTPSSAIPARRTSPDAAPPHLTSPSRRSGPSCTPPSAEVRGPCRCRWTGSRPWRRRRTARRLGCWTWRWRVEGDEGLMAQVRGKIAGWLVQNTIRGRSHG